MKRRDERHPTLTPLRAHQLLVLIDGTDSIWALNRCKEALRSHVAHALTGKNKRRLRR